MRADAPFETVANMRKIAEPAKCGATGTARTDYIIARLLEDLVGVKINPVTGSGGGSEIDIPVEKGEVDCRGMTMRLILVENRSIPGTGKVSIVTSSRAARKETLD